MKYYVYILYRDLECTDPFYVGKGSGTRTYASVRIKGHKNKRKENAIVKRLNTFGCVPCEIFARNMTEIDAFRLEINLIAYWGRIDLKTGCLTNLTDGGEGGNGCYSGRGRKYKHSPEAVQRRKERFATQSSPLKGRKRSKEFGEKVSKGKRGKPRSKEAVEKTKIANTGRKRSPEFCVLMRQINIDTLEKRLISLAATLAKKEKKPLTEEQRQRLSDSHKGYKPSEETRKKLSEATRATWARRKEEHALGQ